MPGKSNILTVSAIVLLLCSCSASRLNHDVVPPGEVDVKISVNWPESVTDKPDQMYFAASRKVGTVHFGYLYPELTPVDPAAEALPLPTVWPNGDYFAVCFTKNEELYRTKNVVEFVSSTSVPLNHISVPLNHISVTLPKMAKEDQDALLEEGMRDFNPCNGFIVDAGNFYSASLEDYRISPSHATEIVMTPRNMSVNLKVRFQLVLKDGVRINSVRTFMSGIPVEMFPMTGVLNYKDLYKINMPVRPDGTDVTGNGETVSTYESEANVFGIFPSDKVEELKGNGIFQVFLSGELDTKKRIFYASINLKNTITAAQIMTLNASKTEYVAAKNNAVLDISSVLNISKDGVIGGTAADGIEKWVVQEFIDVEL